MIFEQLSKPYVSSMLRMYALRTDDLIHKNKMQWSRDDISEKVLFQNYRLEDFYILRIEDEVIASMVVVDEDFMFYPHIPKGERLFLHKLCVYPSFGRHGYANLMLQQFIQMGKDQGFHYISLDVRSNKDFLKKLYEENGFVYTNTIQVNDAYTSDLYTYEITEDDEPIEMVEDTVWPCTPLTHTRNIVRAFAKKNDTYFLLHIQGEDAFGTRDHYETMGGGIEEHESDVLAVHREIYEESGYLCRITKDLGYYDDCYYLLKRRNHYHFFEVELLENTHQLHLTSSEQVLFSGLEAFTKEEMKDALSYTEDDGVRCLVHKRELSMLKKLDD